MKLKFVFEYEDKQPDSNGMKKIRLSSIRKMMVTFENMVNTVFPAIRIHLKEEELEKLPKPGVGR